MTDAAPPRSDPPVPSHKRRRWMKGLLVASLALNALVIGVALRSAWQMRANFQMPAAALEARLPGFVNTLAADRREALRGKGLLDRPQRLRPLRAELRRARADWVRAFQAEPFDRQALVAAQSVVLEAEIKLRRAVQEMLPEIAERMTAEERRAFIGWRPPGFGRGPGPGNRGQRGPRESEPRDGSPPVQDPAGQRRP